jgi:O-antigen ligase
MKFIGVRLEVLVSFFFLWVCEGLVWPPNQYLAQKKLLPLDATDPIATAAHALFLGALIVACVVRREQMLSAMRCGWPILALLAYAFLSAFWADAPELVLRRSLTLSVTTIFAMYLAVRFTVPRLLSMLVVLNIVGIVASFAIMLVAPKLSLGATMDYPDAVRGAYSAKNTLGGISALNILIACYALWRGYGGRLIYLALVPANLALVLVSQSATALMLVMVGGYAATVAGAFRQRNAFGFALGFVLAVVGLAGLGLLAIGWNELLELLNREPTLTGRVEIWQMSWADILHRPWLGYGYGAFWRHDTLEARMMWQKLYWIVPHAHNAWLETGLELGMVGMVGISALWLMGFFRGIRVLAWPAAHHTVFYMALFTAILVENLTEYEFLRADSFFWVMFVLGFVYLGREALVARAAPVPTAPLRRPAPLAPPRPSVAAPR